MKFADAQKKMIEYLKSSDFSNREDAQDSINSIPIFEKIIKAGFITDGSQEGSCTSGYNKDTKRYYRIEERSHVTGFMKREAAYIFVKRFNTETNKVAFIIQNQPGADFEKLFYEGKPEQISMIPVTVSNSATTKAGIKTLHPVTNLVTVMPTKIIDFQKKVIHLNKSEAVEYVCVFDPVYCRKATGTQGLYKDILSVLGKV